MANAGYDPRGALDLWEVMAAVECAPYDKTYVSFMYSSPVSILQGRRGCSWRIDFDTRSNDAASNTSHLTTEAEGGSMVHYQYAFSSFSAF